MSAKRQIVSLVIPVLLVLHPVSRVDAQSLPTQTYLEFNGSNQYVDIPDSDELDLTSGAFTVSAWIRPTGWGHKNQGRILDHGGGSSGGVGWSLHLENKSSKGYPEALRVQINNDSSFNGLSNSDVITLNAWQHVAVTFETGTLTFYVNGIESGISTGVPTPIQRAAPVRIGMRATDSYRDFAGAIDEIRIWNRTLTLQEIQANMNIELSGAEPGLMAYYKFNEGTGQTAYDSTLGGHHGMLGSTTGVDTNDPLWVANLPPTNQPPTVIAGPDQTIVLPGDTVSLNGSVGDDGLPNNTLITSWSAVSGPGPVIFADPNAASTSATFSVAGIYVLRFTADDTELLSSDDLTVTVDPGPKLTSIVVSPDPVSLQYGAVQPFNAVGLDQLGNPITTQPVWGATGGSIDATGLFTAGSTPGRFTVSATDGAISGQARVVIKLWPTNGWTTATPIEMGMDQTQLEQARDYALTGGGSGLITRDGYAVMSWGNTTQLDDVKSTTKSIGVTALGLAIRDGLIDLNDPAQNHLSSIGIPPDSNAGTGWLDDITLLHLATQTAGFAKSGGYPDLLFQPGSTWAYTDGGPNWLADLLTVVYGEDLKTLLFNRVFTPLGMASVDLTWRDHAYREDTINGIKRREFGSGIKTNADSMARIGYLYLNRGEWEDQQIIPKNFVDLVSTSPTSVGGLPVGNDIDSRFANASNHYGMLWWNNADGSMPNVPTDAFWSWGLGDRLIVVIPTLNIVASRVGSEWSGSRSPSYYNVIEPFIEAIAQSVLNPPANQAPVVNAGSDQTIILPIDSVNLDGFVSDDGLPVGSLITNWTIVSGPAPVIFDDPYAANTTATFSAPGTYVLRLNGDDTEFLVYDDVVMTVDSQPILTMIVVTPDPVTVLSGNTQQFSAAGLDQIGNPFPIQPVWSAAGGSIDATGLYAAGSTTGQYTVTATDGTVSGQAVVSIISMPSGGRIYLDFDGNDDYVEIGDHPDLELTSGAFTLSAWIRPTGWGHKNQGRILDHGGGSSGGVGWSLHLENKSSKGYPEALRVQINNDSSFNGLSNSDVITLNAWQHVAVTFETGTLTFYVNGIESGISTGVPTPIQRAAPVRIGMRATDSYRAFEGGMDEVNLWNRALSAQEIQANMNIELSGAEPGLMAYYKVNEGTGQTAYDSTLGGHHGRLGSTTGVDNNDPFWMSFTPPPNQAPIVNAGADQTIILPNDTVNLDGSIAEDGLPSGTLLAAWSVLSGSGTVAFGDPNAVDTTATFSLPGVYVLQLTGDDTELISSDDVTITVDSAPVLTAIMVMPDPVTVLPGETQQFTATGLDQAGNPFPINPVWTATGGSIDVNGLYVAGPTTGQFTVTVIDGLISGDATVFILILSTEMIGTSGDTYKPNQNKVFFHDGTWWGIFKEDSLNDWFIYKWAGNDWFIQTTPGALDLRDSASSDSVIDPANDRLYVLFDHPGSVRIYRLTYSPLMGQFTLDPGFPKSVSGITGGEPANASFVRAKDGTLFVFDFDGDADIEVQWSKDDAITWQGDSFIIKSGLDQSSGLTDAVPFTWNGSDYVGIFYSPNTSPPSAFGFLRLKDGDDPGIVSNWVDESTNLPPLPKGDSDNHVGGCVDAYGRLYFAVKTGRTGSTGPQIGLYMRNNNLPVATWTLHNVETTAGTRPSCIVDETNEDLYVLYTMNDKIQFRKTALPLISFGPLEVAIENGSDVFNNGGISKHNVDADKGLMVYGGNRATSSTWTHLLPISIEPAP